jgi:hypothetical protein
MHHVVAHVVFDNAQMDLALSRKYGLSSSALGRHKNHIEVTMSRTRRRLQEIREQGSVFLLNDILEQVRRNIAAAEAQGDYNAVFRGSHVASRLIYQLGRLEGTMKLDTLHRLISSPAWVPQASLLPQMVGGQAPAGRPSPSASRLARIRHPCRHAGNRKPCSWFLIPQPAPRFHPQPAPQFRQPRPLSTDQRHLLLIVVLAPLTAAVLILFTENCKQPFPNTHEIYVKIKLLTTALIWYILSDSSDGESFLNELSFSP